MTSIKTALIEAHALLSTQSDSARLDAEILLGHLLKVTRTFLYTHATDALDPDMLKAYQKLVLKRIAGEPIAYITGVKEFWSIPLSVNNSTLIPRPETELLVESVLTLLPQEEASILDLGTGSGAIAIALAVTKPLWKITAVDLNPSTLKVAKNNALTLGLNNITFIQSDWFTAIPEQQFDAILSNPPYIEENDPHLCEGDVRFEPLLALTSGADGLNALTTIIQHGPRYLKQNGIMLLEHGYNQAHVVKQLLKQAHFDKVQCFYDLQHHPRVSIGYHR